MLNNMKTVLGFLVLVALSCGCASNTELTNDANSEITAFFEEAFAARLARSPELQTRLGIKTDYGQWDERTEVAEERAAREERALLQALRERFDPATLSEENQLNYRLFVADVERRLSMYPWRRHVYAIHHMRGIHSWAPSFLINSHRIDDRADADNYIERIRGFGRLFEQVGGRARLAAAQGVIPPALIFDKAIDASKNVMRGVPFEPGTEDSALRADFVTKIAALNMDNAEEVELLDRLDAALLEVAEPAYERLVDELGWLASRTTKSDGVWALPDGERFYEALLALHTTTDLSADQVHQIGLDEVARIHSEMRAIMMEVDFTGDLAAFFEFTRADPQFYYTNDQAGRARYLAEAREWIERMEARLPELFTVFPKTDMIVQRVEPFRERSAGKAFYNRPSADGSRPGIYYANLFRMERMPIYQMQALAYHEGIPGHHMQIAIQQELSNTPRFRRFGSVTAFSEGWGLYSEWLPTEIGAYDDPYSNFGRLAMELWRACRLVVDTGLHAKRWSRQDAIDYLLQNTPNPEGDVINAIDRYLVMPGQATAYKIGMLKIMQLREKAELALGSDFDVRRFHDAVLANGPVPLNVLETEIQKFIERERG